MNPQPLPSTGDIVDQHPCFALGASHRFGRIHLPVATRCNVRCCYCDRRYDCVNESRPGVTSHVLSPGDVVAHVQSALERSPLIRIVGVAGPGDPLCNEESFEALRLIGRAFPSLRRCMSTNGLLLPEKIGTLRDLGLASLSVTVNSIDPVIGAKIYSRVQYAGRRFEGLEAAQLLLERQLAGIRMAVEEGILVKINTVLIPDINADHIIDVAREITTLGIYAQNIIPLIPVPGTRRLRAPSPEEVKRLRTECGEVISQITHCRRCRADAAGLLHQDLSQELRNPAKTPGPAAPN